MNAKAADHPRRKSKVRDVRYAECQLKNLNAKIDKLLNKLDEKEQDEAKTPEEECVICVNSKATMQTWPCGHRVVCRKCLVRTIQMAVARRSLPLRCVVCRARVLRLQKRSSPDGGRSVAAADDSARATVGRSYSLPVKLRRRAAVARSRSVQGAGNTDDRLRPRIAATGRAGVVRRRHESTAAGWADPFAADGEDDERYGDGEDDGRGGRGSKDAGRGKLDETDQRCNNQSKTGLHKVLSVFKFWKFLRFKNNKLS